MQELHEMLDTVPWDRLEGAYGPAAEVPFIVPALVEGDDDEQQSAINYISENCLHQETLYESAAELVRPLLLVLKTASPKIKAGVLKILFQIATARGQFTANQHTAFMRGAYSADFLKAKIDEEKKLADNVHSSLAAGLETLSALAHDDDEQIRHYANELMRLF